MSQNLSETQSANFFLNIANIEGSLWEAADQLRANSRLTSSETACRCRAWFFCATPQPLPESHWGGSSRWLNAQALTEGDFIKRRALMRHEISRWAVEISDSEEGGVAEEHGQVVARLYW